MLNFIDKYYQLISIILPILSILGMLLGFAFGRLSEKKRDKKETIKNQRKEIDELKSKLALYEDVELAKDGNYFIQRKTGTNICPTCWAKDHKPMPIFEDHNSGYYTCPCCKVMSEFSRTRINYDADNYSPSLYIANIER